MLGGRSGLSLEARLLTSPTGGDTSPYFTSNSTEFVDLATLKTYVSDKNVPWDVTII